MKNILLITSMYPAPDVKVYNNTSVCHYFAKEWMALGYNVKVVFCYNCYPAYYYPFIRLFAKILANRAGIGIMVTDAKYTIRYSVDDVPICRIPIRKKRPKGNFSSKEIIKASDGILSYLRDEQFNPDIILGHFLHPAIDIIPRLKNVFAKSKTAVVLHGKIDHYDDQTNDCLKKIDFLGYRSIPIGKSFEQYYGKAKSFLCPSGVPVDYIISQPRLYVNRVCNFIYVGSLIKRKYPASLIPAISSIYGDEKYRITYVGDGNEKLSLIKKAKSLGCSNNISFTGQLNREGVKNQLDSADVFIMISRHETFGLVYIEAMARGCIVVASKNEGMEGIIIHGQNGFLCESGNEEELKSIIQLIKGLNAEQLNEISEAGRQTVLMMTDKKVAKNYLDTFIAHPIYE